MTDLNKAVFLSYASQDAEAAKRIFDALRAAGVEVWFDQSELRGGDAWDAKIRRWIKECALFLPVISTTTQERGEGYFRREWKLAVERTHDMAESVPFIVPVAVDNIRETAATVPEAFLRVQWTRLPHGMPSPQFVEQVRKLLETPRRSGVLAGSGVPSADSATEGGPFLQPRRKRPPVLLVASLAVIAVVAGLVLARRSQPETAVNPHLTPQEPGPSHPLPAAARSIAVLPFANMNEDQEASAFFSDGMHEDILTNLALIRELRVTSRTTAMQYRDTKKSLRQIGAELGAAYILEGSVRRIGNKVRVTGQLIDARTDEHVWAKSYDRDLTDVFAIQSELAQAIATALQAALSPQEKALIERRPTKNVAAYDLFLKAREVRNQGMISPDTLRKQSTLLRSAVTLDPEFALAWAELNYTCGLGYLNFYDTTDATRAEAKAAIENAVRLGPDEPSVIRSLGDFHYFMQRDYPRAMEQYEKLARLQPNEPTVYYSIGNVLRRQGRWAEAVANYRKAIQLDPGDRRPARQLVNVLAFCRRYDEAMSDQRRFVALQPEASYEKYVLALLAFNARGSTKEMDEFLASLPPAKLESKEIIGFRKAWARMCGDFSEAIRLDAPPASSDAIPADRAREAVDAAVTLAAHGEMTEARAQLREVSADLRSRLELDPANAVFWSELGRMEAILGHREEALRCSSKAMQLLPESLDALTGPSFRAALAFVHTWTGDKDAAIEEYARLLKGSSGGLLRDWSNVYCLKHGPWAFPLRDDPRFQALLADPKSNSPLF